MIKIEYLTAAIVHIKVKMQYNVINKESFQRTDNCKSCIYTKVYNILASAKLGIKILTVKLHVSTFNQSGVKTKKGRTVSISCRWAFRMRITSGWPSPVGQKSISAFFVIHIASSLLWITCVINQIVNKLKIELKFWFS